VKPYYEHAGITIYHGDCREVLPHVQADVLVTDPPYGMAFVSSKTTRRPITNDHDSSARDEVLAVWGERPALVFGNWRVPRPPATRQLITWFKSSVGPGMGDLSLPWGSATEEIYVLGNGWRGERRANFIETSEQRGNPYGASALLGHPTPKPVGLMEWLLQCAPNGVVLDPFAGVGATLLAAKNLGRRAIGVEIEERYCEIAARRLAQEILL
jgi:site-specific DNA-methyltransferase (adenine-specific)